MRILRYMSIAAAALAIAIALAAPHIPRLAVRLVAAHSGLDIKYERILRAAPDSVEFAGLRVMDPQKGLGLSSEEAAIKISWSLPDPRNSSVRFDLQRVRFIKQAPDGGPQYDTLNGLVALPFSNDQLYDEISGRVKSAGGFISIADFMAKSSQLRLSFNGEVGPGNRIKSDILIFFADDLTSKIPPELTKLVLKDEEPGWKSLSVRVDGDYTMPSIQISSKLFRLNIRIKD